MSKNSCVYLKECANAGKACFKCFNYSFYRSPKERQPLRSRSMTNKQKKEGIDFENKGTKKYQQTIKIAKDTARRQIASGALSFALGDMITEEALTAALAEYKERGQTDAKGEKQITIKRKWLEEIEEEAKEMGKEFYFLPFRFKGDNQEYVVLNYDRFLAYIQLIQSLVEENRLLRKQLQKDES